MYTDIMMKTINYFENDVNRINHTLKVLGFASLIADKENVNTEERKIIGIAAILHDIGIKEAEAQFNSADGKYQELLGPGAARQIMNECNIEEKVCERVCYLVGNHHSYDKIKGLDFIILVESDFIVNIYEQKTDKDNIAIIKRKYFQTQTGKSLMESMYGI